MDRVREIKFEFPGKSAPGSVQGSMLSPQPGTGCSRRRNEDYVPKKRNKYGTNPEKYVKITLYIYDMHLVHLGGPPY